MNLLQAISERANFNLKCDFYESMNEPAKSKARYHIEAAIEIAAERPIQTFKEFVCTKLGHKWVGIGYGNTEAGVMGCECKRCGEEDSTVLY